MIVVWLAEKDRSLTPTVGTWTQGSNLRSYQIEVVSSGWRFRAISSRLASDMAFAVWALDYTDVPCSDSGMYTDAMEGIIRKYQMAVLAKNRRLMVLVEVF